MLNLRATWCVPCREEMPALDRLQKALGGPGFEVLAIRSLLPYVDQNSEALTKLGSMGIPLTLFVDRDGRELWRVLGPREWDKPAEMERLRGQLSAQMDR